MSSAGETIGAIAGGIAGFFVGGPMGAIQGASLGAGLGAYVDPPAGPTLRGPTLDDATYASSAYGVPVPQLFGSVAVTGKIVWLENGKYKAVETKEEVGGKGGGGQTVVNTTYYATFAVLIGEAMPDYVPTRIWAGGKLIFDKTAEDFYSIRQSDQIQMQYYDGTQLSPDSRMEASLGVGRAPAFVGSYYLVFYDFDLTEYGNSLAGCPMKVELAKPETELLPYGRAFYRKADTIFVNGEEEGYLGPQRVFNIIGSVNAIETYYGYRVWNDQTSEFDLHFYIYSSSVSDPTSGSVRPGPVEREADCYDNKGDGLSFSDITTDYRWGPEGQKVQPYRILKRDGSVLRYNSGHVVTGPPGSESVYPIPGVEGVGWGRGVSEICIWLPDSRELSIRYYSAASTVKRTLSVPTGVTIPMANARVNYDSVKNLLYVSGDMAGRNFTNLAFDYDSGQYLHSFTLSTDENNVSGSENVNNQMDIWFHGNSIAYMARGPATTPGEGVEGNPKFIRHHYVSMREFAELRGTVLVVDIVATLMKRCGIPESMVDLSGIGNGAPVGYRVVDPGSAREYLAPLQAAYQFDIIESGYQLLARQRNQTVLSEISHGELGAVRAGNAPGALVSVDREVDSQLPTRYTVNYLDVNREYDTATVHADYPSTRVNERHTDIPIALYGGAAAVIPETLIRLAWLQRRRYRFTLPQPYVGSLPGDVRPVELGPGRVEQLQFIDVNETDGQRVEVSAVRHEATAFSVQAPEPEIAPPAGGVAYVGRAAFQLLDIPMIVDDMDTAGFVSAAWGAGSWPGGALLRSDDDGQTWTGVQSFTANPTIASALGVLSADDGYVIDRDSVLECLPIVGEFTAITEAQMMTGKHYVAYGAPGRWEILRYADVTINDSSNLEFSVFIRGLFGTEWATGMHAEDDLFILLDDPDLRFIAASLSSLGMDRLYRAVTRGLTLQGAAEKSFVYAGVNLTPLSPVHLKAERGVSNEWEIEWAGRTRYPSSIWRTGNAPPNEDMVKYYVDFLDEEGGVVRSANASSNYFVYEEQDQIDDFGDAQSTIRISVGQLSDKVGRGYAAQAQFSQASSVWTPNTIFDSGVVGAWYDISDIGSLFQDEGGTIPVASDGDPVALVLDRGPNGFDLSIANPDRRPTYRTDGTYQWLEFDGVDDWLTGSQIISGTQERTVYAVVNTTRASQTNPILDLTNSMSGNSGGDWTLTYEGDIFIRINGNDYYSNPESEGADQIIGVQWSSGSSSGAVVRNNGAELTRGGGSSQAINTVSDSSWGVGFSPRQAGLGATDYYEGRIYQIVIARSDLDAANINALEQFLAGKCSASL